MPSSLRQRARQMAVVRLERIAHLRQIGAPLYILKCEQLMMARNRQGVLRSKRPSPVLEQILKNMREAPL